MSGNEKQPGWQGTWLSGARAAGADLGYPGERLGLPERGKGSVAGYGRRLVALLIDWLASTVIAVGLANIYDWTAFEKNWAAWGIFAVQFWLLTGLTGTTLGKRIAGLRVARLDGKPVGLLWSAVRTVLILMIIPALMWDRDHRGLHDRAANTIVLEL